MDQIQFPDFMNEENMRKMGRQELVNLYLMMGQAMLPNASGQASRAGTRSAMCTRTGRHAPMMTSRR